MPSLRVSTDLPEHCALVMATLRAHRGAILAWVIGGTAVMVAISVALAEEMADFPGGPEALATSIMPSAESMRPLRWPAERLDTLGGYLTYHNLIVISFFLSLYSAIQGTRAIRRAEERVVMEQVLATGLTRWAVVGDTTLGFALVLLITGAALGLGVAAAVAVGGEPNIGGSMIAMASIGLCAMVSYAIGLVISQFTQTSRRAAGVSGLVLVALYLASTMLDPDDAAGFLAWLSPFWWANKSRALVPGQGADPIALIFLAAIAASLTCVAAYLFANRDYQAPFWSVVRAPVRPLRGRVAGVRNWAPSSVWSATLMRSPMGLASWMISAAAFTSLMAWLSPAVIDVWENFSFMVGVYAGRPTTATEQYMSFAAELVGPVVAAYVIVQASGWVADAQQGRLDMVLSTPRSPYRVVVERIGAAAAGAMLVTVAGFVGLVASASLVEVPVSWPGLARTALVSVAFALAMAGVASALVALSNSGVAVGAMAALLAAMYLLEYLIPMLGWPEEVHWLSLFWAFGHPYLGWPATAQIVVLAVAACGGTALACVAIIPRGRWLAAVQHA